MPFSCSLATSCSNAAMNSCMRKDTSSGGRRQFSLLKANSVRYSTPRSAQARMALRTFSTPRLWPAMRGRKRRLAQRPLPSMITAIWRGMSRASGIVWVELAPADWAGSDMGDCRGLGCGGPGGGGQTAISSASFAATSLSISPIWASVSF